jgi:hypothetical protein
MKLEERSGWAERCCLEHPVSTRRTTDAMAPAHARWRAGNGVTESATDRLGAPCRAGADDSGSLRFELRRPQRVSPPVTTSTLTSSSTMESGAAPVRRVSPPVVSSRGPSSSPFSRSLIIASLSKSLPCYAACASGAIRACVVADRATPLPSSAGGTGPRAPSSRRPSVNQPDLHAACRAACRRGGVIGMKGPQTPDLRIGWFTRRKPEARRTGERR